MERGEEEAWDGIHDWKAEEKTDGTKLNKGDEWQMLQTGIESGAREDMGVWDGMDVFLVFE